MSFDEPDPVGVASGLRLNPKDIMNHLLLVWVIEHISHSPTKFTRPDKPSDVIVCDVVDLDLMDPDTNTVGALARKNWWRQAQLIQALKNKIGKPDPLLVRMGLGTASPGFNPPFQLFSVTGDPQCVQRAQQWIHANPDFRPSEKFIPMTGPIPPVSRTGQPVYQQQVHQPATGGWTTGPPSSHWETPERTYTQAPDPWASGAQAVPSAATPPRPPAPPPPPQAPQRPETPLERIAREAQEQGFEDKPPW